MSHTSAKKKRKTPIVIIVLEVASARDCNNFLASHCPAAAAHARNLPRVLGAREMLSLTLPDHIFPIIQIVPFALRQGRQLENAHPFSLREHHILYIRLALHRDTNSAECGAVRNREREKIFCLSFAFYPFF